MTLIFRNWFIIVILIGCSRVEDKYYIGQVNSAKIRMNVERDITNKVVDYLEIEIIREVNHKFDSLRLFNQNMIEINPYFQREEGVQVIYVKNSFQLFDENDELYLRFYKTGNVWKQVKMKRQLNTRTIWFRGH